MSDMNGGSIKAVPRISVRLTRKLAGKLKRKVSLRGQSESTAVRDALETYFDRKPAKESCDDVAVRLGIIGCAKGLPRDLSTNKRYFKGFGE